MTRRGSPWLADFQQAFSAVLRAPLDRRQGTLRATPTRYPARAVQAALPGPTLRAGDRLAVYNRQYWFRLFGVLQKDLPLTCALLGAWTFNEVAAAFLLDHPPRGHDLSLAPEGFGDFLAERYETTGIRIPPRERVPGPALVQAARIDEAFRALFWSADASAETRADIGAHLQAVGEEPMGKVRLRPSGRFALVEESWPLLALRREALAASPEARLALPAPHAEKQTAAICRGPRGWRVLPLAPLQARLYSLLLDDSLGAALAQLEEDAGVDDPAGLATDVQMWMAESVRLGFWDGVGKEG